MKKILLKTSVALLMFCLSPALQAQCLEAPNGAYPAEVFTPRCDSFPNTIVADSYSGEYSLVQVTEGVNYTFSSDISTDFVTISDDAGTIAYAFGEGSTQWTATTSGIVRFYLHDDAACADSDTERARIVSCGTLPVCEPLDIPFTGGFEIDENISCFTYEDVNGGEDSGWAVQSDIPSDSGTYSLVYTYDADLPGDDWAFTPGLNLTGGVAYNLKFKYRSGLGLFDYVEHLEVNFGTEASSSAMSTEPLLVFDNMITSFDDPFDEATVNFTPETSGVYYVGFHSLSEADQGYIQIDDISVDTALATNAFDNKAFAYYPNPVKDILHFSAASNISAVSVYNLLGQEVKAKSINAATGDVDLSGLSKGAYIVKVNSANMTKTIKIIKE